MALIQKTILWLLIGTVVALLALAIIGACLRDTESWEDYLEANHCVPTGNTRSKTTFITVMAGKAATLVPSTRTESEWACAPESVWR
jgi:hypothetical protein